MPTRRSWRRSIDIIARVAVVIAALQAVYIALSGDRQPSPLLVAVVGMVAVAETRLHGFSLRRAVIPVIVGAVSAGIWWEIFAAAGLDRWVTVADAVLCPAVGIATAWLMRPHEKRRELVDA